MMRTKDAIHQELAIEEARFARLERAREKARTKIELLRSELSIGRRSIEHWYSGDLPSDRE